MFGLVNGIDLLADFGLDAGINLILYIPHLVEELGKLLVLQVALVAQDLHDGDGRSFLGLIFAFVDSINVKHVNLVKISIITEQKGQTDRWSWKNISAMCYRVIGLFMNAWNPSSWHRSYS